MLHLFAASDPVEHVLPHELFHVGEFVFTNQMLMALIAAALLIIIMPRLFRDSRGDAPTGARNFFESILEYLRIEVFRPALKEHTDRYTPFLWSLFFFILFCNLLGQLPVNEVIYLVSGGTVQPHFWGTATGTPLATGALAFLAFVFIHANGIRQVARSLMDGTYGHHPHHEEHSTAGGTHGHEAAHDVDHGRGHELAADVPGDLRALTNPSAHYADDKHVGTGHAGAAHYKVGNVHVHQTGTPPNVAWISAPFLYLWNFAPHPFKPGPGESPIKWLIDVPMWAFLLLLELIGAVIKPFALMIRLFANMIAGHIVLASLIALIPVTGAFLSQLGPGIPVTVLGLVIRFLELFVAFLQAYIFTFLATLFIASAVAPEH
jgi:F0F1-type ATP synthase membrane subunit a